MNPEAVIATVISEHDERHHLIKPRMVAAAAISRLNGMVPPNLKPYLMRGFIEAAKSQLKRKRNQIPLHLWLSGESGYRSTTDVDGRTIRGAATVRVRMGQDNMTAARRLIMLAELVGDDGKPTLSIIEGIVWKEEKEES